MTSRVTLCVAMLALGVGLWAQTPDRVPSNDEALGVDERIRALQSESDRLAVEARTLLAELRKLETERDLQVERVREAQAAIVTGQAAVDEAAGRMLSLESQRLSQLPDLRAQLVDVYKRGRSGYVKLLLSSTSVREFGRATRAVAAMIHINQQRLATHRSTIEALAQEHAKLETELAMLRAREAEARQAQAAAERAVAARSLLIAQIDSRRDLNAQLAGDLQVAQQRLRSQAAAPARPVAPPTAAARPAAASATNRPAAAVPSTAAPVVPDARVDATLSPLAPFRGKLNWPVSGRVTGRFAQSGGRLNNPGTLNGIEIASREGNPARALHSGTVTFAGPSADLGNMVTVDHGDETSSLYGYLGTVSVRLGDLVKSGAELGRVGPAPEGPATLYLEIRIGGRSVDPLQWLRPL